MKWCFKHEREYGGICSFCEEEFQPPIQTNINNMRIQININKCVNQIEAASILEILTKNWRKLKAPEIIKDCEGEIVGRVLYLRPRETNEGRHVKVKNI